MSDLRSESTSLWNINLRFLASVGIITLGGGYWLLSSKEWFFFYVLAILCLVAGSGYFIQTVFLLIRRIRMDWAVAQYARQGVRAKGDELAKKDILRQRGMIK